MMITINSLLKILYVRGYFKNQETFLKEFLERSVENPYKLSLSGSTLKGYYSGNSITELAKVLADAGFSPEKMSKYIESLYENKCTGSPTYKQRFGDKTYKDILYENAKDKYPDLTPDNMAATLANAFTEQIEKSRENDNTNKSEIPDTFNSIPKDDLTKISNLILEVRTLLEILIEKGNQLEKAIKRQSPSTPFIKIKGWEEFHKYYEKYEVVNIELYTLIEEYKLDVFESIKKYKNKFVSKSFWCHLTPSSKGNTDKSAIDEYYKELLEISKEINKYLMK